MCGCSIKRIAANECPAADATGIGGIVLAAKIARRAPHLPVLVTTGYTGELVAA